MIRRRLPRSVRALSIVLIVALTMTGCSSLSNTEKGAAIGAGAGGAAGAVIGNAADNTAAGAIIGAAVGGTAGAIIGQRMDKQAEELEQDLEGAEVERVGEGIMVTFDNALLFDFDSAALRANAETNLADLAESLQDYEKTEVLVVGHTDAIGPDDYNQRLSERRAESAANHLMEQGLRPSRITTMGKGEREPVATNDTEAGRQQNRRVEVAIYASEEYREAVQERTN